MTENEPITPAQKQKLENLNIKVWVEPELLRIPYYTPENLQILEYTKTIYHYYMLHTSSGFKIELTEDEYLEAMNRLVCGREMLSEG